MALMTAAHKQTNSNPKQIYGEQETYLHFDVRLRAGEWKIVRKDFAIL